MQVIEILNYTISNNIKESGGVAIDKEQQRSQRFEPERLITFQKGQGFHMKKKIITMNGIKVPKSWLFVSLKLLNI